MHLTVARLFCLLSMVASCMFLAIIAGVMVSALMINALKRVSKAKETQKQTDLASA